MSKRKADSLADNVPTCSLCSTPFNDDAHAARRLACGHHFCSVCLAGLSKFLVVKTGARTSKTLNVIICPADQSSTELRASLLGDVSKLKKLKLIDLKKADAAASASSSSSSSAAADKDLRIFVKNMAGDTYTIEIRSQETVIALKHRIQQVHAAFVITRQRLILPLTDDDQDDEDWAHNDEAESDNQRDDADTKLCDGKVKFGKVKAQAGSGHEVLEDARTLASYDLQSDTIISLVIADTDETGALSAATSSEFGWQADHVCICVCAFFLISRLLLSNI